MRKKYVGYVVGISLVGVLVFGVISKNLSAEDEKLGIENVGNSKNVETTENNKEEVVAKVEEESNDTEEFKSYLQYAEEGDIYYQKYVSRCYLNGIETDINHEKSFEWSMKVANSGDAEGMLLVGWHYYKGLYKEQNHEEAMSWFSKSAELGNSDAMNLLGTMYRDGEGTDVDYEKAVNYFLNSAGNFNSKAMYSIANMVYNKQYKSEQSYTFWAEQSAVGSFIQPIDYNEKLLKPETNIKINNFEIPKSFDENLVNEVINSIYSGTYYNFLDTYSLKEAKVNTEDLTFNTSDEYSNLTTEGLYPWNRGTYLYDFNDDGVREYANYVLEGSAGVSSLTFAPEREDKTVNEEDAKQYDLGGYGANEVISYNGKTYILFYITDLNYGDLYSIDIYSLNKDNILESCSINVEHTGVGYVTTKTPTKEDESVPNKILKNFDNIFSINKEYNYYKISDENLNGEVDINNDGVKETYEFYTNYTSTVNWQTHLWYKDIAVEKDLKTIQPLLDLIYSVNTPQYLNVMNINGVNYVYVVAQKPNHRYYNLTIYEFKNKNIREVSKHLIYFDNQYNVTKFEQKATDEY